jgi:hypothetical protein
LGKIRPTGQWQAMTDGNLQLSRTGEGANMALNAGALVSQQ